uniref:Sosondowah ankyrin repeat domain family member B n=1 Tax=Pelusios castaneus TaxID=367368 RepID=A0A8C8RN76_9SAUR
MPLAHAINKSLSQEELLDFLCRAGGRVTNAALLAHFHRFLRAPAPAEQLQRRREQFKGFVNAVATVQQPPGGPKYVVLRRRYRDLLGEEPGLPIGLPRDPPATLHPPRAPARLQLWPAEQVPSPAPPLRPEEGFGRPLPVFKSIRCQLALPELEGVLDLASPSGGAGSPSPQQEGERWAQPASKEPRGQGCPQSTNGWPSANGAAPCPREPDRRRGRPSFRSKSVPGNSRTSSSEDELMAKDQGRRGRRPLRSRKLVREAMLASPDVDAPITFQHLGALQRQDTTTCVPMEEVLPTPHRPSDPRPSFVPLDPREHNWVVMVAAGSWMQVRALFLEDPQLALRRDFISGYTALHWMAKHGASQVLQDFISGTEKAGLHLDVNVKSSCGYTPLHLAAIHGHQTIMMLLVQKLKSKVHLRDSSGKRPWQYLNSSTSGEVWLLLGAPKGKTIFPTQPLVRHASPPSKVKSQEVARSISRKTSLAACLKPQHRLTVPHCQPKVGRTYSFICYRACWGRLVCTLWITREGGEGPLSGLTLALYLTTSGQVSDLFIIENLSKKLLSSELMV